MIKKNQKNKNECDKNKSHISRKHHMIYKISNNDRKSVTKTPTPFSTIDDTSFSNM